MGVLKEHEFDSFFMRLEHHKKGYTITFMPKMADGSNAGDRWYPGGGVPGLWDTSFASLEKAEIAWNSLLEMGDGEYSEEKYWQWIDMENDRFPDLPEFFT